VPWRRRGLDDEPSVLVLPIQVERHQRPSGDRPARPGQITDRAAADERSERIEPAHLVGEGLGASSCVHDRRQRRSPLAGAGTRLNSVATRKAFTRILKAAVGVNWLVSCTRELCIVRT
jgi:hypothetical protein